MGGISLLVVRDLYGFQFFAKPLNANSLAHGLEFLLLAVVTWETIRWILGRFRRGYPLLSQSRTRLLLALPVCWGATVLLDWLDMLLINATGYHAPYPDSAFFNTVSSALLRSTVIVGALEAVYYFARLLRSERETEALKKEHLQTQLESLKQQISPHFLFNSLSTLSSLVAENPRQAERFIEELASVYRYLLRTNDQPLTSLADELDFIRAYFHLLQMRFGRSVELALDVDERHLPFLIPPLTLQLLVENAVKHNAALPARPLRIRIYSDEADNLFVLNNLQKKQTPVVSSQLGLRTITSKYRLLGQADVVVKQTDATFQVLLPLIQPATSHDYPAH